MARLKKFLSAIMSDWLARMSGPLTVPFTIAGFLLPSVPGRALFTILAVVAALVTCYRVWAKEYERAEVEIAKHSLPLLKGKVLFLRFTGIRVQGHNHGQYAVTTGVSLEVYVCNFTEAETNLQDIKLDGSGMTPPVRFGDVKWSASNPVLSRGKGITMRQLQSTATIDGFTDIRDVPPIGLDKLKAFAVDGFLREYPLEVPNAELTFSS